MRLISHRGNLKGPKTALKGENHPDSIKNVISCGYDCEIDLRIIDNRFYLGHDEPEHEVPVDFIHEDHLWVHAKNFEALKYLAAYAVINGFYHENDKFTLTTQGFIWTFPDKSNSLSNLSIAALPEIVPDWQDLDKAYGICTDFISNYDRKAA